MSKENRETILNEVKKIICNDRNEQYGEPEDSFEKNSRLLDNLYQAQLRYTRRGLRFRRARRSHNDGAVQACANGDKLFRELRQLYRRYRLYDLCNGYRIPRRRLIEVNQCR